MPSYSIESLADAKHFKNLNLQMHSTMPASVVHRRPAPIDTLPIELLVMVLRKFIGSPLSDVKKLPQKERLILICVCRHWKLVVESCPDLWSRIVLDGGRTLPTRQLQLASQHPLDVVVHFDPKLASSSASVNARRLQSAYDLVRHHQWDNFALIVLGVPSRSQIEYISFRPFLDHIIAKPTGCNLTSFDMSGTPVYESEVRSLIADALRECPAITHLSIDTDVIPATHPIFKTVKYLELHSWTAP